MQSTHPRAVKKVPSVSENEIRRRGDVGRGERRRRTLAHRSSIPTCTCDMYVKFYLVRAAETAMNEFEV
jgi:hypothetical protein